MPRFTFNTNVSAFRIPDDFLRTSTNLMSKTLGKNIAVSVMYESKYIVTIQVDSKKATWNYGLGVKIYLFVKIVL